MATVSERARNLWLAISDEAAYTKTIALIEQALLAERRLAMEEAEEIVRNTFGAKTRFIQALRAAAEKESGPRGGE